MSQYAYLSEPDPEWLQLIPKLPKPQEPQPTLDQRRIIFNQMLKRQHELWDPPYPKLGLNVAETTIPVEGAAISIRTYVPETNATEESFPLLVWFHGGSFVLGDLDFDDALLRLICVNQRISCVNVDYRLAPENPFPIPVQDCYNATKWAAAHADSLSVDLAKGFIVGGSSAGGNLAAVVALKSRNDLSFKTKLSGQVLQIPYVCPSDSYPEKWKGELLSAEQFKDSPVLNRKSRSESKAAYAGDPTSVDFAPLLAETHKDLPAAYLQVCGIDPLRDDGILYEKVLRESGVRTKLDVYPGQPHGFHEYGPHMTQSKKYIQDVQAGVGWLLQVK